MLGSKKKNNNTATAMDKKKYPFPAKRKALPSLEKPTNIEPTAIGQPINNILINASFNGCDVSKNDGNISHKNSHTNKRNATVTKRIMVNIMPASAHSFFAPLRFLAIAMPIKQNGQAKISKNIAKK